VKGFLQVVSLFGVPLAIVIWYDLFTNTPAYQFTFNFSASRPVAIGIHLVTAFLCLHLPLRLWRRFDAFSLRLFCLSGSLVLFWVVVRLVSSGRLENVPVMHTIIIFLVPIITYPILRYFLFKLASPEFEGQFDESEPILDFSSDDDESASGDQTASKANSLSGEDGDQETNNNDKKEDTDDGNA